MVKEENKQLQSSDFGLRSSTLFLRKLSLSNFKNYSSAQLSFAKKINFFIGPNGSGKTNLLDAIHYLCLTKSYFNPVDQQNILHNTSFFRLDGIFTENKTNILISCILREGKKKELLKNKVPYTKLADHVGEITVVMVAPDDNILILGGSEERRRFVDNILSQLNRQYLDDLVYYTKILTQRNRLLKQFAEGQRFNKDLLLTYDEGLIVAGGRIYEQRKQLLQKFSPVFNDFYKIISGDKENVSVDYESELHTESFQQILKRQLEKDRMLQRTTSGIHRDDIVFIIDGFPVKKFGSQGQQKSFLLSLKLAQHQLMTNAGKMPLLMLDDIFDKLDSQRVENVFSCISDERFSQIFITDTDEERIRNIFKTKIDEAQIFRIKDGEVSVI